MTSFMDKFSEKLDAPNNKRVLGDENDLGRVSEQFADSYSSQANEALAPLFVEIEGSLIREHSSKILFGLGWGQLGSLLKCLAQLPLGRARFNHALAKHIEFDPANLLYNEQFLEWLWGERESDRPIWILTSADEVYAKRVANFLGIFDGVIASNAKRTLFGDAKLAVIRRKFGAREPFDYCGAVYADLNLFAGARHAILVGANAEVQRHTTSQGNVLLVFD